MNRLCENRRKLKAVIILGSARKNGETQKVVDELVRLSGWETIDLLDYDISHFDYEHRNRNDNFIGLMQKITEHYDVLVFATPVYWYAMSGVMKVFFDRLTDLLRIEKEMGRKLRNKQMAVISSSNGDNLGEAFWLPFKKSAEYLGMHYVANLHTYQDKIEIDSIAGFKKAIEERTGGVAS